ncbi:MAG: OsmC family protein [Burkholderiales bacterium]|nr:OsmC family protein [Burkholderiales bacterium]
MSADTSDRTTETVRLDQVRDYQFDVGFGPGIGPLRSDEPPPLGQGAGPSPVQLLAAAVGNCLSASLLFALRKYKQSPEPIHTEVEAEVGRNEQGRLRVLKITASLHLGVPADQLDHLKRALDSFEAFCTVTQSVGQGIPVEVRVWDSHGERLK